jgi:hypothetical protein
LISATRHDYCANVFRLEHSELSLGEVFGAFGEFNIEAKVWLI